MENEKYYLLSGQVKTGDELTQMYRQNLRTGLTPIAGYFCPICNHEMMFIKQNYRCENCSANEIIDYCNEKYGEK